jgi:hypothetical protein
LFFVLCSLLFVGCWLWLLLLLCFQQDIFGIISLF